MGRLRRERKKQERRDKRDRRKSGRAKATLSEKGAARRKSKSSTRVERNKPTPKAKPSLKLPTPDTQKAFPLGETSPAPKKDFPLGETTPNPDVANIQNRIAQQEQVQAEAQARYNQAVALEEQRIDQPGGWKNLLDINKIASVDTLKAFGEGALVGASVASTFVGVGTVLKAASIGFKALKGTSVIAKLGVVGTTGIPKDRAIISAAQLIPINSVSKKITATWLSKFIKKARDPKVVGGAIMTMIGTYPFAYFVGSEALQSIGFGVSAAIEAGNLDQADEAIVVQEEILDWNIWEWIANGIPYLNIANNVRDLFIASTTTKEIYKQIIKDKRFQAEFGETDSEMFGRIAQERKDAKEKERITDADYYSNLAKLQKEAKALARADDAKFYQDLIDKREEEKQAKRKADEDYWSQYYRLIAKQRADSAPSNLKFGLL